MIPYYDIDVFRDIYLEDSYVLGIRAGQQVEIDMEFVLRESHPEFVPPNANHQYCYRRGTISFPNSGRYDLTASNLKPAFDDSGQVDLGNIDVFNKTESGYSLSGDWGELVVVGPDVSLELKPLA